MLNSECYVGILNVNYMYVNVMLVVLMLVSEFYFVIFRVLCL